MPPWAVVRVVLCSILVGMFAVGCASDEVPVGPSAPLALDPTSPTQRLDGHVDVLLDPSGELTLDDLRDGGRADDFVPFGDRPYLQGSGAYGVPAWLRVTFTNATDQPIDRVLQLSQVTIDHVEAFPPGHPGGSRAGWSAGQDTEIAQRVVRHHAPRFPVRIHPGDTQTWYVLVRDEGTIGTVLEVADRDWLELVWARRQTTDGGLVLLLGWVVFSAAVLSLVERSRTLALFTVTMAGLFVVECFYFWGVPAYVFPAAWRAPVVNRVNALAAIGIWGGMASFTIGLLKLDVHLPRTTKVLWAVVGILAVNALYIAFVDYGPTLMVSHLGTAGGLLVLFGATTQRAIAKDVVARALLAAFALYLLSYIGLIAKTMGAQGLLADALFPLSTILFVTGLVVALQRYSRQLRLEHETAQAGQLAAAQRNARLSSVFERFVPKEFLQLLDNTSIEGLDVGRAVERPMTVLFSDIRGFTTLSEHMPADESFTFVNRYLAAMEPGIHGHGGFIDKYMGDGIMALFQADRRPDAPIAAAVQMMRALDDLNAELAAEDKPTIRIGIGIHTGPLVLGTVGGETRISATVIGDAVNLAARVEGATKRYHAPVLVTESVVAHVDTVRWHLRVCDRVVVKGRTQPVTLFEVLDALPHDVAQARIASMVDWSDAWQAYQDERFAEAAEIWTAIAEADPTDWLAVQWAKVSADYAERRPDDWDGTFSLVAK